MSESGKTKIFSKEHRIRISKANTGRKNSEEVKNKMKEASKNRAISVVQLNMNGFFIAEFTGLHEAERLTGINNCNISSCCKGKLNTAGGYRWMYAEEYYKQIN